MYKIKVIHISFHPISDGTETMIRKYFVLVRNYKFRLKEVSNCYTCQLTKGPDIVHYQLWQLSKYHLVILLVDLVDHMDFKNPNKRDPKR